MTVGEFIELLQTYPADLRVVVNGYEDGYDDLSPEQLRVVRITLGTGKHKWEGEHDESDGLSTKEQPAAVMVEVPALRRVFR